MKIRIHPLFFAAIPLYALFGGIGGYLLAFFAITIHELSHFFVALIAGARDMTILLMPYGATLVAKGDLPHFGAVLLAGPMANFSLASFALSACWLFPELYGYCKGFIALNALLAILNLLPAYPLDGGRLFRLLFPWKWARIVTFVATIVVGLAALVFFFVTFRVTYLIFASFMLLSIAAVVIGRRNRRKSTDPVFTLASLNEEGRVRPATIRFDDKKVRLSSDEVTALLISHPPDLPLSQALRGKGI